MVVIEVQMMVKLDSKSEWQGCGYWRAEEIPPPHDQPVWLADVWYAFSGQWDLTTKTLPKLTLKDVAYFTMEPTQIHDQAEEWYKRLVQREHNCSPARVVWTKIEDPEIPF